MNTIIGALIVAVVALLVAWAAGAFAKSLTSVGDYSLVLGSDAPKSTSYVNAKKVQDCLDAAKGQPVVVLTAQDDKGDTAVTSCVSYPSITGMKLKAPRTAGTYVYSSQTIPQ